MRKSAHHWRELHPRGRWFVVLANARRQGDAGAGGAKCRVHIRYHTAPQHLLAGLQITGKQQGAVLLEIHELSQWLSGVRRIVPVRYRAERRIVACVTAESCKIRLAAELRS